MENITPRDIINTTIKYKLDSNAIKARAEHRYEQLYSVHVSEILGTKVNWDLEPFFIENLYQYFEMNFMEELFDRLLNNSIGDYYNKHDALIVWVNDEAHDAISDELSDYCHEIGISWDTAFRKLMDRMGKGGLLSASIYYHMIAGYFESVAKMYFNININDVTYTTPQGIGKTEIYFLNGTSITVSKDFFTGHQFYNELTRLTTTDSFLAGIRNELKGVIWRKANST